MKLSNVITSPIQERGTNFMNALEHLVESAKLHFIFIILIVFGF